MSRPFEGRANGRGNVTGVNGSPKILLLGIQKVLVGALANQGTLRQEVDQVALSAEGKVLSQDGHLGVGLESTLLGLYHFLEEVFGVFRPSQILFDGADCHKVGNSVFLGEFSSC